MQLLASWSGKKPLRGRLLAALGKRALAMAGMSPPGRDRKRKRVDAPDASPGGDFPDSPARALGSAASDDVPDEPAGAPGSAVPDDPAGAPGSAASDALDPGSWDYDPGRAFRQVDRSDFALGIPRTMLTAFRHMEAEEVKACLVHGLETLPVSEGREPVFLMTVPRIWSYWGPYTLNFHVEPVPGRPGLAMLTTR